eukprot:3857222-Heterocapsa_arctica.AAC.1
MDMPPPPHDEGEDEVEFMERPHHPHWDLLMEFLGRAEPGAYQQEVDASRPVGRHQRFHAELVARRAWEQLLRDDCTTNLREGWSHLMPDGFADLTDDYELLVLVMWIWADRHSAEVHTM